MSRIPLNGLLTFHAVARERSFTKAAGEIGVTVTAISHNIRDLEERLDMKLLARTTRTVELTEAGQRVLELIGTHLDCIKAGLATLSKFREKVEQDQAAI